MPADIEKEETITKFRFSNFAKTRFQPEIGACSFYKEPLKGPLLVATSKKTDIERVASVAISLAIKRFCKDVNVPDIAPSVYANGASVISVVFNTLDGLSRRLQKNLPISSSSVTSSSSSPLSPTSSGKTTGFQDATEKIQKKYSLKKLFRTKSSKSQDETANDPGQGLARSVSRSNSTSGEDVLDLGTIVANVPTTELDLIQFIVGHGILRKDLRDEIYCQLCCQVTKNPSPDSAKKGWMLHALCTSCFMPSEEMLRYYFSFLSEILNDNKDYASFAKRMLHRTSSCGLRFHPPTWLEFQAAKIRKHIMIPVSLPNGRVVSVECDSAMTASEMCHKISTTVKLRDQFGFAIYIVIMNKVSSLGNGSDHVMDAIAECEQLMRCYGKREEQSPWQLFFRKELFTPWHDAENDAVATDLIYQQIVRSVLSEEYRLRSEDEMARFLARRWYIEQGQELVASRLQSMLTEYLPRSFLSSSSSSSRDGGAWAQAITDAFNALEFPAGKKSKEETKGMLVDTAQRKWPLQFSALFEAYRVGGPSLPKNQVVMAVNCRGVFLLDEPYRILAALHYYEIVDTVFRAARSSERGPSFGVITIRGDEMTFVSPNAETIAKLLTAFIDGLRRRSRWAVSIQDFVLEDHTRNASGMFHIVQGDVLELLDETQQKQLKEDWMYGRCERTGAVGSFPFDCVYIFPTCEKPPPEIGRAHV